jgi:hypothetical protein
MAKTKTDVKKNTALVKRTQEAMAPYPEGQYNRLLPTTTILDNLGNLQEPKIEVLQFDPDKDAGDVYIDYRLGKNKRLFTKNALDKIAYAGGLSWYAPMCVTEERNSRYVRCRATAVIKKANGEPLMITKTKEIDLDVEEEEIRDRYDKKIADGEVRKADAPAMIRRDLLQLRKNMLQLCESKACNRVIRAAFGIKSSYTVAEISKPFVMVRFDTTYDLNDPKVLQLLASSGKAAVGMMFPDVPEPAHQLAAPADATVDDEATKDDMSELFDGEAEEEETLTPEQEALLAREGRIQELVDGCDYDKLKGLLTVSLRKAGYTQANTPENYRTRWNDVKAMEGEAQLKALAEMIVDLEEEAGGDAS